MCHAQLRSHDPVSGGGNFKKTGLAEPLSKNWSVVSAIQALVFYEMDRKLFVKYLVKV
jgi:hypothetical protein